MGFTAFIEGLIQKARIPQLLNCPGQQQNIQPPVKHTKRKAKKKNNESMYHNQWHQGVLQYLVHPRTPITRLMVVWQLGAGKTLGMVRILDISWIVDLDM